LSAVILTLVVGPFQPLIAQAQVISAPGQQGPTLNGQTADVNPNNVSAAPQGPTLSGQTLDFNPTNSATTVTQPGAVGGAATDPNNTGKNGCSWSPNDWDLCITDVVYVFTVGIGSSFAYVAAEFFNLAVNISLSGPAYALTFISTGWTTARDLANMAFLFILIYIAFMIMFNAETSGTMSLLAGVIVIALLVNFSFFFTRLVIDAGNILSIQFYNSITAPSIQSSAQTSNVAAGVNTAATFIGATKTKDLTASIMGMLQLQNLFGSKSFDVFHSSTGFFTQIIVLSFLYIAAAIMFYLLTVMFVTIGVKFLMRVVVLWFLIIASPLAFVARAMPPGKLRGYFDQWRDMLVAHAFYPAAFMFIFLILTNFTNQMGNCTNNGSTSSQSCLINDIFASLTPSGNSSTSAIAVMGLAIANVAIRMGFVIAILYMGMKASDKISVMGAGAAKGAGNWVGGKYIGAFGAVGRHTVGTAGYSLGQTRWMQDWASKDPLIGRTLLKGFNKAGAASFDVRTPLSAVGVKAPGKAQKGGYKADVDARVKWREKQSEQYSNELTKEEKDTFEKKKKEAKEKFEQDKKQAKEKDGDAQKAENLRAEKEAESKFEEANPGKRATLAADIETTSKKQQDAAKAQSEAAENLKKAAQDIKDLESRGKQGTPEMDAAITERKNREAAEETSSKEKATAEAELTKLKDEQKEIEEKVKKDAKELTKKIEETKVEETKVVAPTTLRGQYADSLEHRNLSRLGAWIPAADKKAADKIRKGKTTKEKMAEVVKELEKEEKGEHEEEHKEEEKGHAAAAHPTPAAAAPRPSAATPTGGSHDSHSSHK
ncbi:MAG TPA: hypothetical protein VIJ88_01140, partial [Candidatus Paceibacterota bacterium]